MSVIKNYKITARTISPIHIGSGEEINKKQYWYNERKRKIGILNMPVLYEQLSRKKLLKKFEEYMLFENKPLLVWMNENGISQEELNDCTRYVLSIPDAELSKRDREIFLFYKDAYGNPYIPGSSIKGSISTMLMSSQIQQKKDNYEEERKLIKKDLYKEEKKQKDKILLVQATKIKEKEFHTLNRVDDKGRDVDRSKAVMNCMSGIRISDSLPLDKKNLTVCKKIDIYPNRKEREIPVYRECLKPGTVFSFEISIDTSVWKYNGNKKPYTIEDIRRSIDTSFEYYQKAFLDKFKKIDIYPKVYPSGTFCLGGGVGFHSKTILYPVFSESEWQIASEVLKKTTEDTERTRDREYKIAPRVRKCTNYAGRTYDMGICQWIRAEEL